MANRAIVAAALFLLHHEHDHTTRSNRYWERLIEAFAELAHRGRLGRGAHSCRR
jgi:hypothetical protein